MTIPDGQHVLRVTANDAYGNVGSSLAINIEVDATAPTIRLYNPRGLFGINEDSNGQLAGFQVVARMEVQGVELGTVVQILDGNQQVIGSGQLAAATLEIPNITVRRGTDTDRSG